MGVEDEDGGQKGIIIIGGWMARVMMARRERRIFLAEINEEEAPVVEADRKPRAISLAGLARSPHLALIRDRGRDIPRPTARDLI